MSFELIGGLSIPAERYTQALLDTLAMVSVSAGIALVAGIPLAVLLIVTAPGAFWLRRASTARWAVWSTAFGPRPSSCCWWR